MASKQLFGEEEAEDAGVPAGCEDGENKSRGHCQGGQGKKEMERLAATKAMGVALWPQNFLTVARFCQKMSH